MRILFVKEADIFVVTLRLEDGYVINLDGFWVGAVCRCFGTWGSRRDKRENDTEETLKINVGISVDILGSCAESKCKYQNLIHIIFPHSSQTSL